jgi:hypothetical protein
MACEEFIVNSVPGGLIGEEWAAKKPHLAYMLELDGEDCPIDNMPNQTCTEHTH